MGVIDSFVNSLQGMYSNLSNAIPQNLFLAILMFFFAIGIVFIAFIIWKFYNTLSKKDFIVLNLRQYNWLNHPDFRKFLAVVFYVIENILIMPFFILLWFILFSIVLLVVGSAQAVNQILMLAGALVLAIRILAYSNEELSKELAKVFPFIALSVFLLNPKNLELLGFLNNLKELPILFGNVMYFLIAIFIVEIVLRVMYTLYSLAIGKEELGDEDEE